ncbi:DNA glycosylase AlkZ-like family protein [Cellulomonas xiejunii]|uniref:DNA glycosylase AlkZ-like family protein n=1 Tax=Cellulomonas xiejunii TaxID=2968083 RepID=UPI0027DF7B6F|nr:crosslink repair DNA glycosylase YcaQ family protein [Cellulomonas xiejunii]
MLWSRLGSAYEPAELRDLVDQQRLVELRGFLRPADDVALFRAEMDAWPGDDAPGSPDGVRAWLRANDRCRQDVLELLRADGPLPASRIPDTCVRPWRSTGWNDRRNVQMLLGLLAQRGEVAIAGSEKREKLWALASRVYPDVEALPLAETRATRDERRLRALGIARASATARPDEPDHVGLAGEPAVVEGVRGEWRVDPATLDQPFVGRAALLSPLDRLVLDRKRMTEIFEFHYQLEMYKPATQRRWGYRALPVLHGDRLVGKLDATADVRAGVLRVTALHRDVPFTAAMTADVEREIADLAAWLELELVGAG